MSTLPLRALHIPAFGGFTRLLSNIGFVFDVLAEARTQARAAHKRYPFADW
jgi:hypothetical protein